MIDELTIQKIKEAANIVDVIGDFYDLKKKGITYQCLCPFHEDHHIGSFVVSPRKNTYTCYSCGEHGDSISFIMKHENLSYIDAIRWLGRKYSIETDDDAKKFENVKVTAISHRKVYKELPMLTLPIAYVRDRVNCNNNTLANWIRSLGWDSRQMARVEIMIRDYILGTSRQGHSIFWQIDDHGLVRTGKLMLYKQDGHRDKVTAGNFKWIHSELIRANMLNPEEADMKQCLYGMHLLHFAQPNTVSIVESEKTAIVCAIAYGNMTENLWMASGGKTNLTREKLQPIMDMHCYINLYPDKDGVDDWRDIAKTINYDRINVRTEMLDSYWIENDGPKADLADIIVRMITDQDTRRQLKALIELEDQRRGSVIIDEIISRVPAIGRMIDKLHLEYITEDWFNKLDNQESEEQE